MDGPGPSRSKAPVETPGSSEANHSSAQNPAARLPEFPFVPTLAVTLPDNYGGLNPENEANLDIIDGVAGRSFRYSPRPTSRVRDQVYRRLDARDESIEGTFLRPQSHPSGAIPTSQYGYSKPSNSGTEFAARLEAYLQHDVATAM